jgi:2'-5' RNA ligase
MRVFIAFPLPETLTDVLSEEAAALSEHVSGRFVGRESYHVTIAFLGEVEEGTCKNVVRVMDDTCAGAASFDVLCTDLRYFGKRTSATLWQGMESAKKMTRLAEKIRSGLRAAGIPFDRKPFLPHITLARKADLSGIELEECSRSAAGRIDQVVLYRSDLSADGARYTPLHTIEL